MNNVANYAHLRCKIFVLKIWRCKILDKYHVCAQQGRFNLTEHSAVNIKTRSELLSRKPRFSTVPLNVAPSEWFLTTDPGQRRCWLIGHIVFFVTWTTTPSQFCRRRKPEKNDRYRCVICIPGRESSFFTRRGGARPKIYGAGLYISWLNSYGLISAGREFWLFYVLSFRASVWPNLMR